MKHCIIVCAVIFSLIFSASMVRAHPGNTDAHGGHYCRTNCRSYGLQYGQYHYHNGRATKPHLALSAPKTIPEVCDENLWMILSPGTQRCDYGFWNFIFSWGIIYCVSTYLVIGFIDSLRKDRRYKNEH